MAPAEPISTSMILALAGFSAYGLGFLLHLFLGNRLGRKAGWLAVLLTGLAAGAGIGSWLLFEVSSNLNWEWLSMGGRPLMLGLRLDLDAARMLAMITGITFGVNLYSSAYMADEKAPARYWGFLSLFAFAMLMVILAGDLLLTFLGWELVGLASYFLIGFYRLKKDAAMGSQKAFVMNRIGDAGFVIALMAVYFSTGGFQLDAFSAGTMSTPMLWVAGFGLMAAAFGKSAQFPLQIWLPDAMAGPTPVSSLIHAATMVAAGVYLMLRYTPFLLPVHMDVLAVVGALTALMAAISGLSQTDIKRVLAYSTVSQLGLMMMGVGVGGGEFAFFHLFTHAFFKCGLFLSAGAVIHSLHHATHHLHVSLDEQDMRWMGGLGRKMPLVAGLYLVFAASLAGLPFFSGFLSKDGIVVSAWIWAEHGGAWHWLVPVMGILASAMTAFYVARQGVLVFWGENRAVKLPGKEKVLDHLSPTPWAMLLPMIFLAAFSLWAFWSPANPLHPHSPLLSGELHGPAWLPWMMIGIALSGVAAAFVAYRKGPSAVNPNKWFFQVSFQHFFWDRFVDFLAKDLGLRAGRWTHWWDKHVVDGLVNLVAAFVMRDGGKPSLSAGSAWLDRNVVDRSVNALAEGTAGLGAKVRTMQSGKLQRYLIWALTLLLLLVLLFVYFLKSA